MERREESETAEPQKDSLSVESCGQPRERTSVAVSERAQQKDCRTSVFVSLYVFAISGMKRVDCAPDRAHATPSPHWLGRRSRYR